MATEIFGYMRISTDDDKQTVDRQFLTLQQYAEENGFKYTALWGEQISGSVNTENRPEYSQMMRKLGKGDTLVVTDIDRLGRNADNILKEVRKLKEDGIKLIAIDTPYLNEWNRNMNDESLNDMVLDILITLKAHMAQQERKKITERVQKGIDAKKARQEKGELREGERIIGRPTADTTEAYQRFVKEYKKYLKGDYGKLSMSGLANICKIGRTTLYKYINIYEGQQNKQQTQPTVMEALKQEYNTSET